jgi:hypothetical protein
MLDLTSSDVAYIKGLGKAEYNVYWALGSNVRILAAIAHLNFTTASTSINH